MIKNFKLCLLSVLPFTSSVYAIDCTDTSVQTVAPIEKCMGVKENFADKLSKKLQTQQQESLKKEQENAVFKANAESCQQFFYADGQMKTEFEVASLHVISNFIQGLFNTYLDVVATQDEIARTYALTLSGTPAIEKLNEHFLNKIKDQSKQNYRTIVNQIEIIDSEKLIYKANITVESGEASVMVDKKLQNNLKKKNFEVTLNLVKAPTFTKKSTIVVKNGIITPKKEWIYNPFELWVKDFSIISLK